MSIPIHTTTIRVIRSQVPGPFEPLGDSEVIAFGVRAQISTGSGFEAGGTQEVVSFRMTCDPVDLHHLDRVEDEETGEVYEVQWVRRLRASLSFGLNHTQAGLKQVAGALSEPRATF